MWKLRNSKVGRAGGGEKAAVEIACLFVWTSDATRKGVSCKDSQDYLLMHHCIFVYDPPSESCRI